MIVSYVSLIKKTRQAVFLFIVLHELHFMKYPTGAIFSVVCSSDIVEQHYNIIKRLWHLFRLL